MTREIKFRCWYPEMKRMFYQDGEYHTSLEYATWSFPIDIDIDDDKRWSLNEKSILMQFTNLKDKNGKEIYEGDIVTAFGRQGVVKFSEGYFDCGIDCIESQAAQAVCYEVIGNIFQNPDLLTPSSKV